MIPLTLPDLKELIFNSQGQRQGLKNLYSQLPDTSCQRRALCCSLLPELSLLEALEALDQLRKFPPARRRELTQKIIRYFFINPAEITGCPFLEDRDCLIYPSRFFGCRAYGLWSKGHYRQIAHQARLTKEKCGSTVEEPGGCPARKGDRPSGGLLCRRGNAGAAENVR